MRYMTIDIGRLSGNTVLSGSLSGKSFFMTIMMKISTEPEFPSPLILDFREVSVATASFLRESVFVLKSHLRANRSNYYPVLANLNNAVIDEIAVLTEARDDAIISCRIDDAGLVTSVQIIGQLEPKQAMTFNLVQQRGQVDAIGLMREFGETERTTSPTAWNNRLSSLVSRGLVREYSSGRAKSYRPIFERNL
jgi:hypothetical protein